MKIQQKVLFGPGLAILVLLAFGVMALMSMRSQLAAIEDIFVNRFGQFDRMTQLAQRMDENHGNVYRLFLWIDALDAAKIKAKTDDINKNIDESAKWVEGELAKGGSPQAMEAYKAFGAKVVDYRTQVSQAIMLARVDMNAGMSMMQAADGTYIEMEKNIVTLVRETKQAAADSYVSQRDSFGTIMATSAALLAIGVIGSIAVSLVLGRQIMKPLRNARECAARIADGDLTVHVDSGSKDEVGDLLRSLEAMRGNLTQMIGSIRGSADRVSQSTGELASAAGKVAKASLSQSDNASSMAAAVEELTVSINQMADNANHARELSLQSGDASRNGGEVIRHTVQEMSKIAGTVTDAASTIQSLGEQSTQISLVVGVIKEIADQTNLLALNAAIEAARAGEQGRGFAVVADEVRKLAERTTRSTEEIRQVVATIQDGSERAVVGMERAVAAVKSGETLAAQAGESTNEITSRADSMVNEVSSISAALKEQGAASNEIATRVENIVRMSEENSVSAQSSSKAAQQLRELAQEMIGQVGRFRV